MQIETVPMEKAGREMAEGPLALREVYGKALLEIGGEREDVVVLDADVSKGTYTKYFAREFPGRFFNLGIAESNMMGVAAGFAATGYMPFVNSYAVFCVMRACETLRTFVAYPKLNVKIAGGHGGLSVGPDGVTHQATEDIAIVRAIPNMAVLVPADPVEVAQVVRASGEYEGPVYIRLARPKIPNFLPPDYQFRIGKSITLREGSAVTFLGTGVMVIECLKAADELAKEGISARVINVSSIKPIDEEAILKAAEETGCFVTAEDHNVVGGLGGAVSEVLAERKPAPLERIGLRDTFGESGSQEDLFREYHLTVKDIIAPASIRISSENIERLLDTMTAFRLLMKSHRVERYKACATSAMREATNGKDITRLILKQSNIEIDIIDRKSTRLNSSHTDISRMPSSA